MAFLYPGFLCALAALAIPIVIHLFNFRRFKKIAFTNVRFLREIKLQTRSQNRLKHLLILLMRLLALAFLVVAFSQPYIPESSSISSGRTKTVSVFLDNSFSMQGEGEAGEMLEVARNKAIDIALAYNATDRFQLLTHDFEARHQRLVGQNEFIELVQEVDYSPQSRNFEDISARQRDILQKAGEYDTECYVVSDFQKSRFDFTRFKSDTTIPTSLVHLPRNSESNLYIDSAWFDSAIRKIGDEETLTIRIRNLGSDYVENIPLSLEINGKQMAIGSFSVAAGAAVDTSVSFVHTDAGQKRAKLSLQDFPIVYDDAYYFAYTVYRSIDVLAIRENVSISETFLRAVFSSDSAYVYSDVSLSNVDYSTLSENDFIVLYELSEIPSGLASELSVFVKNGGSVWLIPARDFDIQNYNEFLTSIRAGAFISRLTGSFNVRTINSSHPVFSSLFQKIPRNVDLPKTSTYFKYSEVGTSGKDNLLGFSNGDPFLTSSTPGEGNFYCLTAPLSEEDNTFSRHALFVASALRLAELSQATALRTMEIGGYFFIPARPVPNDDVFHLTDDGNTTDLIPQFVRRDGKIEINPGSDITRAGNYDLLLNSDTVSTVGINFPKFESDLSSYSDVELRELASAAGTKSLKFFDGNSDQLRLNIEQASRGKELWTYCLMLVLVFLLGEELLLRFWNRQRI